MPRNVIVLHAGLEICGFEELMILTTANRLGEPYHTSNDAREYVRDPGNRFRDNTMDRFEPSVVLPPDAIFTGYRSGAIELWFSDQAGDGVVFIGRQGIWEQWPRAREPFACAA